MDNFPIKFRSPPPKPPRRRHSDQLSISPSGTFPSKKKFFDENLCCGKHQEVENSTSSCGSLPSNWTPDFSSEVKSDNVFIFEETKYNISNVKNGQNSSFGAGVKFNEHKNNVNRISYQYKNTTKCATSNCESNIYQMKQGAECHSRRCLDIFHRNLSNLSFEGISGVKISDLSDVKSIVKEHHRRHNSDPLPSNFINNNSNPHLPSSTLNVSNKLFNPDYSCELEENQCLLLEVKSLKEMNNRLWEHLCLLQASLDNVKKHSIGNSNSLSISGLLSSLYESLKNKEKAMEDRMEIIVQERNNAIQDLDSMVQILAGSFEDKYYNEGNSSNKEIKELLQEIEVTCNPIKLLQQQRLLLSYLYRSKELKQDYLLHQLKMISSERDSLKSKVKLLEAELGQLKLSNEIWNTDNKFWESSLLNTLYQVIQQRDVVVKNYSSQNLDYFNSRSSTQENSFDSDTINHCLQKLDGVSVKKKIFQSPQNDIRKYSPFSVNSKADEIRYLKEELIVLNKSLEVEMEKRENAEEKCIRLERLVHVLQKKINGQNVGIPV